MSAPGSPRPHADTSVRVADAGDASAVAAVQVAAWRQEYAGLLRKRGLADTPPSGEA